MQNVVISMCEEFHYDRSRNDRALGNRKSDNNRKNNVCSAWRHAFPGLIFFTSKRNIAQCPSK